METAPRISQIKFLGEYDLPHNLSFNGTTVGGLSEIDYDRKNDSYYLLSDDRSAINPARFYTARIFITGKGIDSVAFTSVHSLLQRDGNVYPNSKQDSLHTPDPEAMRYNPVARNLVWSSEGERIIRQRVQVLEDPAITVINTTGMFQDSFPLPANMHMHATENGPRQNSVFEGMSFADKYKTLFVNVEEPIFEDGPRAGLGDSTAVIRILKYDVKKRKLLGQFAYRLDPVAYSAIPAGAFKINGVPDILWMGDNKLLVIERSFSTGRRASSIKVFLADLGKATDIQNISSLVNDKNFIPAEKKLLLNMDELKIYIDNIEGVTFGPRLPNGHRSLIFVSDNNFSKEEITQFLLFEVLE